MQVASYINDAARDVCREPRASMLETMNVRIDPELGGRVALGVVVVRGLLVRAASAELDAEIHQACDEIRRRFGPSRSGDVPETADARSLYKSLGIDPTKTRPSNEALLRRVLKGEALYRINTLVDAINLVSLRTHLPFGLYDAARVVPPVTLRRGRPGEAYEGIRKGEVHVDGRPVLVDAGGPFGNPTSDSARTMITTETHDALITAYAPPEWDDRRIDAVLDGTIEIVSRTCGGTVEARGVVR